MKHNIQGTEPVNNHNHYHTPQVYLARKQEGYSSSQTHITREFNRDSEKQPSQGPFVIYILCDQLKHGMGNALIDTGSQISLVAETSLARGIKCRRHVIQIHGIMGNVMETKGQTELSIGETSPHEFMVVSELPMDCDIVTGQDWLERFGYQFQVPNLGINLPAYSETLICIPTTEKGQM
jgi:hypothetical protein